MIYAQTWESRDAKNTISVGDIGLCRWRSFLNLIILRRGALLSLYLHHWDVHKIRKREGFVKKPREQNVQFLQGV